jgi:hypothetical protein
MIQWRANTNFQSQISLMSTDLTSVNGFIYAIGEICGKNKKTMRSQLSRS